MWRTSRIFWSAAIVSKFCLQRKIEKHYMCDIITFNLFHSNSTKCYMRINKQLNNLVYNDMKNLTYILISCNIVCLWQKLYLFETITLTHILQLTTPKCYLRISKQLINLVYNDMKILTYILICSNGVQSVFWYKIEKLYLCEIITFNKFRAIPNKCRMRRNKQLIKLVYNNVKNFTYILISCNCVQFVSSKKALSVRITFNMLCCNSTKMLHADEQRTY